MKRISGLDGVRALAITFVIAGHLLPHHPSALLRIVFGGQDGVGLFFILSGFLVTALLLREQQESGRIDIPHFYFRRAMRIVPPLLAYLAAVLVIASIEGDPVPMRVVASVVFFYHNMTHEGTWMLEHTWSLAVEEQFYLLWPLLLVATLRRSWRTVVVTCSVLLLLAPVIRLAGHAMHLGWMRHKESYLLVTRMDSLLAGCLTACLVGTRRFEELYKKLEPWHWIAPVFLFVVSPLLTRRYWFRWDYPIGYTLNAIAGAYFILWLSRNEYSWAGRLANYRAVAQLGLMSYSVYLWQTLPTHYAEGGVRTLAALAFLFLMTCASFYLVERQAARMRSVLERRLFRSRVVELPSAETIEAQLV